MRIFKAKDRPYWFLKSGWSEKDTIRQAGGWRWDWDRKRWWTDREPAVHALFRLTGELRIEDEGMEDGPRLIDLAVEDSFQGHPSMATDTDFDPPCREGLAYLPFQKAGIQWALERDGCLIADEMGLGKTVQAVGVINADYSLKKILVVCPASLKLNWRNELQKWLDRPLTVGVAENAFPPSDVVVVNYDRLKKFRRDIDRVKWDLLVVDESHHCKNPFALRTKLVMGFNGTGGIKARKRIALTGTPIDNRPAEIFTVAHWLAPEVFPDWLSFAFRYCEAEHTPYGLEARGAANLPELQSKLRNSIMIRRRKKDVLKDLPEKWEQEIVWDCASKATIEAADEFRSARSAYAASLKGGGQSRTENEAETARLYAAMHTAMAAARRHALRDKLEGPLFAHLEDLIEENGKVIVFCAHLEMLEAVRKHFGRKAVHVDGGVPVLARQRSVEAFQTDPAVQVFVGQTKAAGTGLTLTAANIVVFAELDWQPANIMQAGDRAHRIGQTRGVIVQYIVLSGSIDEDMRANYLRKTATNKDALDKEETKS